MLNTDAHPRPARSTMKRLTQYFFRGLLAFLPLALTVYVLIMSVKIGRAHV